MNNSDLIMIALFIMLIAGSFNIRRINSKGLGPLMLIVWFITGYAYIQVRADDVAEELRVFTADCRKIAEGRDYEIKRVRVNPGARAWSVTECSINGVTVKHAAI